MTQLLVLTVWASIGVTLAWLTSARDAVGWMPLAMVLGPFWAAVAADQRAAVVERQ